MPENGLFAALFPVKKVFFSEFRRKSGKKAVAKKCRALCGLVYNWLVLFYKIFFHSKRQKEAVKNASREKKNERYAFKNFLRASFLGVQGGALAYSKGCTLAAC